MILLVAATPQEIALLGEDPHIEKLICGIGPVEAAVQTARALAQRPYRLVINAGIAGALDDFAHVGDAVVVAEDRIALELETGAEMTLPAGLLVHHHVRADAHLVAALVHRGFPSATGLTVTHVTATDATAARIAQSNINVESMEGFAVLRAAELAGISAVQVRGISNRVGDREKSGWDFAAGVAGCERILRALLEHLEAIGSEHAKP